MSEPAPSPVATRLVRRYLERSLAGTPPAVGRQRSLLELAKKASAQALIVLTDQVEESLRERAAADAAYVYLTIAEHIGPGAGLTTEAAFDALVWLCEDGKEPASQAPAGCEQVRRYLVSVTVSYHSDDVAGLSQEIVLLYDPDRAGVKKSTVRRPIEWDDLPSQVRGALLRMGIGSTAFQVYPPAGGAA